MSEEKKGGKKKTETASDKKKRNSKGKSQKAKPREAWKVTLDKSNTQAAHKYLRFVDCEQKREKKTKRRRGRKTKKQKNK